MPLLRRSKTGATKCNKKVAPPELKDFLQRSDINEFGRYLAVKLAGGDILVAIECIFYRARRSDIL
jgi:hypothetical protein